KPDMERIMKPCTSISRITLAVALTLPTLALAAPDNNGAAMQWDEWTVMRGKVIHASDILAGDVSNNFSLMGNVEDLILSADAGQIQYILYDIPFPYNLYGNANEGFVTFDNIELERGYRSGINVEYNGDSAPQAP